MKRTRDENVLELVAAFGQGATLANVLERAYEAGRASVPDRPSLPPFLDRWHWDNGPGTYEIRIIDGTKITGRILPPFGRPF